MERIFFSLFKSRRLFKYPQAEVRFWIHKSCRGSIKAPCLPVSLTLEINRVRIPLYYFESFV